MSKLFEKLANVQKELKAPKNQRNTFGKYNYRSKEDILEAAKPLCIDNGLVLTIDDKLLLIGDRYYIQSAARVTDVQSGEFFIANGYAREAETKKGMDESQITGAASSYSGKYALNNLFGIDDTKDADATNTHAQGEKPQVAKQTAAAKTAPATKPTATPATKAKAKETAAAKAPVKKEEAKSEETPATPVSGTKAAAKKAMTDKQKESFLKGIEDGKFALVEKHLKDYAVDANSKEVKKQLDAAKSGK